MDKVIKKQLDEIKDKETVITQTLIEWCEINSGSQNLQGLEKMKSVLIDAFLPLGGVCEVKLSGEIEQVNSQGNIELQQTGDALVISKRQDAPRQILLCGHMDTVFPVDSDFQVVKPLSKRHLNGPGVSDMKGGLLVMLHALMALEQSSWASNVGWKVLINADEEIGSLGSRYLIEDVARKANLALVYEPAMNNSGLLAGERKGSGKFSLIVKGKAAHAGRDFNKGRNAICYLADIVSEVNTLNGQREGLTVNVGLIAGGTALNVVAEKAVAKLDVRMKSVEDSSWFLMSLQTIVSKFKQNPDYQVVLHGDFSRVPKRLDSKTMQLLQKIKIVGSSLNMKIDWAPSGGCCDGNNIAATGVPVVDTLGVIGGKIHSSDEYIVTESLVERAQLSALLLMTLANEKMRGF